MILIIILILYGYMLMKFSPKKYYKKILGAYTIDYPDPKKKAFRKWKKANKGRMNTVLNKIFKDEEL